jgi:hypothetical protein
MLCLLNYSQLLTLSEVGVITLCKVKSVETLISSCVTPDGETYILSARPTHRGHSSSVVACLFVGIPT